MAQTYKVQGVNITSAGVWGSLYSCPAATSAIVNSVYIGNRDIQTGISTAVSLRLNDSSASKDFYLLSGVALPGQASLQPLSAPIVLETSDSLQVTDASGFADVTVSVLEIT